MDVRGIPADEKRRWLIPAPVGILCLVLLLLGRLYLSYAPFWILGMAAVVFIAVVGSPVERATLFAFVLLALLSGGQLTSNGLRAACFFALLMVMARYARLNPYVHLVAQAAMMLVSLKLETQSIASFAFAPSILLLLLTSRIPAAASRVGALKVAALSALSLVFAGLGFGSRSALFVWLLAVGYRSTKIVIGFLLVLIPIAMLLPDLPVLAKLLNSFSEVSSVAEDSGAINLRGIETLIFLDYAAEASWRELLAGSTRLVFIPGEILGSPDDPLYLPHNQLLGLFFQFGSLGLLAFATYVWHLARYYALNRECRFLLFCLLPSFMLFKHGFLDSDFALIMASVNWVYLRDGKR